MGDATRLAHQSGASIILDCWIRGFLDKWPEAIGSAMHQSKNPFIHTSLHDGFGS
jgi:hypothetical protein